MASAAETVVDKNSPEYRKERAIRMVRALMNSTADRGCSEEEAMNNADKVGELMKKYDLELTDVAARDVSDMVQVEVFAADDCAGRIITGIGRLCSLQVYHKTGAQVTTYVLFGHAPDVQLGSYLYEMLSESAEYEWSKDMQANGYSKRKRDSFRAGFASRVCDRMTALRAQRDAEAAARAASSNCTDLVVIKDQIVVAEFQKTGVKLTKRAGRRIGDYGAFSRGGMAGERANLNNPIEDKRGNGVQLP